MRITNYSELVSELKAWSDRSDLTDEQIGTFIYLAGNSANQLLRTPAMEHTVLLDVKDGDRLEIPYDFLELRNMTALTGSNTAVAMEHIPFAQFMNYQSGGIQDTGPAAYFTRQGPYWFVTPNQGTELRYITCHYYRSMPDLSPRDEFNWLIDLSPMSYLYGGLHYLYLFIMDTERAEYWRQKFDAELARVQNLADKAEYAGSHLVIRMNDSGR